MYNNFINKFKFFTQIFKNIKLFSFTTKTEKTRNIIQNYSIVNIFDCVSGNH